jgi:hypothetical protein
MTIHIEKTGDPNEPFDPAEYIKELLEGHPTRLGIAFFTQDASKEEIKIPHTTISVSASWNEAPYGEVFLRYCRHVLWIFARACRQAIQNLYSKVVFSGIGRRS